MKAQQIHNGQWIAENKVIRPYYAGNPSCHPRTCKTNGMGCACESWERFQELAKKHTYVTDLDGIYQAEDMGEVVWQIETTKGWSTITAEEYKVYIGSNVGLRQFLTLNPHPMKEETTPIARLQVDMYKVEYCTNCPFSSWSWSGGIGARRRTQHKCNLQDTKIEYNQLAIYSCFDTCPLKTTIKTVSLK